MLVGESTQDDLIDRLAEEFVDRWRDGERPAIGEYASRYPELADRLRELFPLLVEIENADLTRRGAKRPADSSMISLVGDYRILREIGRGGMGVVYEAEQLSLGRRVALKILPMHVARESRALERFRREARSAAKLHHTNIVPVFEVGQEGDVCYYAMQLIQGRGLDHVIAELRRFRSQAGGRAALSGPNLAPTSPPQNSTRSHEPRSAEVTHRMLTSRPRSGELEFTLNSPASAPSYGTATSLPDIEADRRHYFRSIARIIHQGATGLAFAHERGIIHRDIKPSNLLLDAEGVVWITDFGLAKAIAGDDLTHSGDVVGTIRYMAPERFRGEANALSDIYSLGLTLYELLVLRPAFDSPDRFWLIEQVKNREPAQPRSIDPRIPRDLETIVLKAIDKDQKRRYATAEDMAEDLHRFLVDEPILARQISLAGRMLRWSRRNRAVAVSLSIIATLLIAGVAATTLAAFHFREQQQWNARLAADKGRLAVEMQGLARQEEVARRRAVEAKEYEARLRQEAEDARRLAQAHAEQVRNNLYYAEMNLAGKSAELPSGFRRVNELLANWRPVDGETDLRGWEFYYLAALGHRDLRTLRGHAGPVVSVRWNPASTRLASASTDATVRVWDVSAGQPLLTIRGHQRAARAVAWSPDGNRLASAGDDGIVRVCAADSGREALALAGHAGTVWSLAWNRDGSRLASAGNDATVRLWDSTSGDLRLLLDAQRAAVRALAWSPDGARLASAGEDASIRIWNTGSGVEETVLTGHGGPISSLDWSLDGARLASASWDGTVKVWSLDAGREPLTLSGHESLVTAVAWSPDGARVASAGEDGTARVWSVAAGREEILFRGHTAPVYSVSWDRQGTRLASASWDETIRVWSLEHGSDSPAAGATTARETKPGVVSVAWSPDGLRLAVLSRDGAVRLQAMDAARTDLVLNQPALAAASGALAWNPDSSRLASASGGPTVRVWDARDGHQTLELIGHSGPVWALAWSPDGSRLATGGEDATVRIWEADSGKPERTLRGHSAGVFAIAWSPDGRRLLSGGGDRSALIWEVADGQPRRTLRGHFDTIRSVCWNPAGTRVATTGDDAMIKVWDADGNGSPLTLRGHFWRVWSLAWNRHGRRLASASSDATVRIWEVETGQETLSLRHHAGQVRTVSWSPDGLRLASAGDEGTIRVEDATPGCFIERSPRLLPLLDRRIAADPRDLEALRVRGDIQARRGRWDDAAVDLRLALTGQPPPPEPWFQVGWWVIGPYPEDMQTSYPPERDSDPFGALARPDPGSLGTSDVPQADRRWRPADPEVQDYLDFGALFDHAEHISAYAVTRVFCTERREVAIRIGADDTARIWLNGVKVYESPIDRGETPVQDTFSATLRAGWNTVLARVSHLTAAHALYLRISASPADR